MKYMSHDEIRNKWINFFNAKNHKYLVSAPVVPYDDESLLFINAGMTPLKDYFDGTVIPANRRMQSIQKCIRTNDVENVGVTARHLTFFEMMGNFSIGDYFKNEALEFAFEFLTSEEEMGIPVDKLYVTIYPEDQETHDKWVKLGIDKSHIIPLEENYWEIGEGPCGPDTEIFYDLGEDFGGSEAFEAFVKDEEQDRYVEIWNNVFSQFNSKEGVERKDYVELPHKNIDTGAGLERWAMIFQNKKSIFETDLFEKIIKQLESISGKKYDGSKSFKVIIDHIRAITFGLADGAVFANAGRGYVLRRLLRRSVRFGKKIGIEEPFMYKLANSVNETMQNSYPELASEMARVTALILDEEDLFHRTLSSGEKRLKELIDEALAKDKFIAGSEIFKLYDTYGFPYELSLEYLEEAGCTTSRDEFVQHLHKQVELSRSASTTKGMAEQNEALMTFDKESKFVENLYEIKTAVIGLFKDGKEINSLTGEGLVILKETPFYAESGGQAADRGAMKSKEDNIIVEHVFKAPNGQHVHKVNVIKGSLELGEEVIAAIKPSERQATRKNHSSVHLVQETLRKTLSSDIKQAGSYVDHEKFRFDFTYVGNITEDMIVELENNINKLVDDNRDVKVEHMNLDDAKKAGALAFFSDKYDTENVRVLTIGDSKELCGGTHVSKPSDIERVAILSLESIGSNIYRLEGTSSANINNEISKIVKKYIDLISIEMDKAKKILKDAEAKNIQLDFDIFLDEVELNSYEAIKSYKNMLQYVQDEVKKLSKTYDDELVKISANKAGTYKEQIKERENYSYLIINTNDKTTKELMAIIDELKDDGLVILINNKIDDYYNILLSATNFHAGNKLKLILEKVSGKGGGSPKFASGRSEAEVTEEILLGVLDE